MIGISTFRRVFSVAGIVLLSVFLASCDSSEDRANGHYQKGLELVEQGEFTKASLEFRNALRLKTSFPEALFAFAQSEERQGNFEGAVRAYLSLREQDPQHLEARTSLAFILLSAGQVEDAQELAQEALTIDETNPLAKLAMASVQLRLDNRGEAVRLANEVLDADPSSAQAIMVLASERMLASKPEEALTVLEQLGNGPDLDMGVHVMRLAALDAAGNDEGVVALYDQLIDFYPELGTLRQSYISWLVSKEQLDAVETKLREFLVKFPEDDSIPAALVSLVGQVRGTDSAVEELNDLIAMRTANGQPVVELQIGLAQLLLSTDKAAEANELLTSVLASTNDNAQKNRIRLELARASAAADDEAQTLVYLEDVLASDEKNVDALGLRAIVHASRGELALAAEDLTLAINEAPENARLRFLMADVHQQRGDITLAEEQYSRALALSNNSAEIGLPMAQFLVGYGKTDQARRVLEAVAAREPSNRVVLETLAQIRLMTQDWAGAQEIADRLADLDEDASATANRISAAAMGGLSRLTDSISLLENSAQDAPDDAGVLTDLIRAYVQSGRIDTAVSYLTDLIAADSANIQARVLLGSVKLAQNLPDEAEAIFVEAATVDEGVMALTALAQMKASIGDDDAAISYARQGVEKDPGNTALRLLLATIYERQADFANAIAEYEVLFEANPNLTIASNGLASLLSERGDGEADLERAYNIAQRFNNSDVPHFLDTLGWINYLRGDYARALPQLRTAAERLPENPLVQMHLGLTLLALQQYEQAEATLTAALNGNPPLIDTDRAKVDAALAEIAAAGAE